jgi:hypothetical protein
MEIERDKLPTLKGDDPIFTHFPEITINEWVISWEQWDNISGMTQHRGLNGAPPPVTPVGIRRMNLEPGVYGEHALIDERELTVRRQTGTFGTPIDLSDIVLSRSDQLASRDYTRVRYLMWTLLQTGAYSAVDKFNVVDNQYQFTPQTFTAATPWSTAATSTPLADLRQVANLNSLGTSAVFDDTATAYMNMTTLNRALANSNAADLGGRRFQYGQSLNTSNDLTKLFMENNLPQIKVIQDGYFDEVSKAFTKYVTDGKVVVIGKRPAGETIGNFVLSRQANNPNFAPGRYIRTIDKDLSAMGPRSIEIHRGFNGLPLIKYPRAIVIMNV